MRKRGFTIIELLVVITIMASLLALGLSIGPGILEDQRIEATKSLIRKIDLALAKYKQESDGAIPSSGPMKTTQLLRFNLVRTGVVDFNANEVNDKGEIVDPWGTPLRYDTDYMSDLQKFGTRGNPNILILSYGPDKIWDANKDQDDDEFDRDDISGFDGFDD